MGLVLTSPDAVTWEEQTVGGEDAPYWQGVNFCQDQFIAVGPPGKVAFSADGQEWSVEATATDHFLNDAACDLQGYIVVGDFGTILQSCPS